MLPEALERAVFGMYATHALHLADTHGVLRFLLGRDGTSAAEMAAALDLDEETLARLLIALDALALVESTPSGYRLPDSMAPFVDPASPRHIGGFVHHLVHGAAARMPVLDDYLRRGKAAVDAALPPPFDTIYATEQSTAAFLHAMWQLSFSVSGELAALAGLEETTHLIDVGGAGGAFAVAALERAPHLRATVYDLPQVEPHLAATVAERGLGERLGFVAGDFLRDDQLPAGDCFAFGYILSDWTDETCLALLSKAYRACSPGGRVLVMERLFDEDRRGPLATAVMNLSMHVETQGRHRTAAEYTGLLARAGWTDSRVARSSQDKHLVVAHKP